MVYKSIGLGTRGKSIKTKAPREADFQRKLIKLLRTIPNSKWFVKEAKAIRGIPDIIGCIAGKYVALEVKRSEAESKGNTGRIVLQKQFIKEVVKAGGYACLIYPENHQEILEDLWNLVIN